jgi:hypothetical protein
MSTAVMARNRHDGLTAACYSTIMALLRRGETMNTRIKATIYLPEEVHRRLKIRAAEERSTITDLVLQAVTDLLSRPPAAMPGMRAPRAPESRSR